MRALAAAPWATLTCLVLLLTLELSARRFFDPRYVSAETYAQYYPAYDYGFSNDPVCWPVEEELRCLPTPYLDVVPQAFPSAKPHGEKRVFTIGSSVSRHDGEHAYSNALERELNPEGSPRRAQFINLSASSIGSERQLLRVREAVRYAPDLIILHPHFGNERKDARDRAYREDLHRGLGGLALRSRAVVALKKLYAETTEMPVPAHAARDAPDQIEETPEAHSQLFAELERQLDVTLELCARRRVPVLLVGSVNDVEGFASEGSLRLNDLLRARAGKNVRFFDTHAMFQKLDPSAGRKLFRDPVHLNGKGHRVLARAMASLTKRMLRL